MITREALRLLENNLVMAKLVNREYDGEFGVEGRKIGDTLNVRKPARYIGRTGPTASIEDHVETSVPVVLDQQFGVDLKFTSKELALSLDDFSDRVLAPAVSTIANYIDRKLLELYSSVYNVVGTPGTTPNALSTYLNASVKLDNEACPRDQFRYIVIPPVAEAAIVDALKGLLVPGTTIGQQFATGRMGQAAGFTWYSDQNVVAHAIGAYSGTPVVNGANQTGATLVTEGWSAGSQLHKGDVITVAGVYAVNPMTRESTGQLRQFVVTQNAQADGTGNMTISISPPIITTGAFKTVTNSPADNASITVFGSAGTVTPQGVAFHRDAFVLVTADLPLPPGTDASRVADPKNKLSIRMVRQYDITNDVVVCRLDVLFGVACLRPELACRIAC